MIRISKFTRKLKYMYCVTNDKRAFPKKCLFSSTEELGGGEPCWLSVHCLSAPHSAFCPLCENGAGAFSHVSFASWHDVKRFQQRALERHSGKSVLLLQHPPPPRATCPQLPLSSLVSDFPNVPVATAVPFPVRRSGPSLGGPLSALEAGLLLRPLTPAFFQALCLWLASAAELQSPASQQFFILNFSWTYYYMVSLSWLMEESLSYSLFQSC